MRECKCHMPSPAWYTSIHICNNCQGIILKPEVANSASISEGVPRCMKCAAPVADKFVGLCDTCTPAKEVEAQEWIQLTPRFENGNFAGYNQTNGTHFYDNDGQQYEFVTMSAYEKVVKERDEAIASRRRLFDSTSQAIEKCVDSSHRIQEKRDLFRQALERILPYVNASYDEHLSLAVFIPASEQMRRAADALDKKDADIQFARRVLAGERQ